MNKTLTQRLIAAMHERLADITEIRTALSVPTLPIHLVLDERRCRAAVRYLERRY
jgi:hypothetical protein